MPTILRVGIYRFHFYSDEGKEPSHIHVASPDGECKFWLNPVRLSRNKNLKPHELRKIEKLIFKHHKFLKEKFDELRQG